MSETVRERLFIVGCARSGTTLLQALLAGHPEIATFPETHFFEKSLQESGAFFLRGLKMRRALKEWIDINPDLKISSESIRCHWMRKVMVSEFKRVMDHVTVMRGKSIWLEKTPGHIMHVDFIEKHIKDARFIHIIRDGRAVVASLYEVTRRYPEAWGGARPLTLCVKEWNDRVYRSFKKRNSENHFFVFYHNLADNPESELKKICGLLKISYSPTMIESFKKNMGLVAKDDRPWMKQRPEDISDEGFWKFSSTFNDREKLLISRRLVFPDIKKVEAMFIRNSL